MTIGRGLTELHKPKQRETTRERAYVAGIWATVRSGQLVNIEMTRREGEWEMPFSEYGIGPIWTGTPGSGIAG